MTRLLILIEKAVIKTLRGKVALMYKLLRRPISVVPSYKRQTFSTKTNNSTTYTAMRLLSIISTKAFSSSYMSPIFPLFTQWASSLFKWTVIMQSLKMKWTARSQEVIMIPRSFLVNIMKTRWCHEDLWPNREVLKVLRHTRYFDRNLSYRLSL